MKPSALHSHYYTMPIKVRWSGCVASIVLSIIATIVLNLLLRGCTSF